MASWSNFEAEAPDLARRVRSVLDGHKHKLLATLRQDGSPRISGTEVMFIDGDLWAGSMWEALKARDLRRDPRFALHAAPIDAELTVGDAKIAGRAVAVEDDDVKAKINAAVSEEQEMEPPQPYHLFRFDIDEVVLISVPSPPEFLLVESWHEGRGYERLERR